MSRAIRRLLKSSSGAVAPTVALSLFGLIAAGGIAFDYARMAGMDTELQSGADQAALAAASQLDGNTDACARAAAAAATMLSNKTLFANDSQGTAINVQQEATCDATGKIRFWQDKGKTTPADDDSNAKFVEVEVDPREAFYALTPIVAAVSSGQMKAVAFAGLDSAICKVPPLMLCNPDEASDPEFTIANYVGKGIRLVANDGGGIYGPGNFGFLAAALDTGGTNGANVLRQILGREGQPGDCVSADGVTTDPGNMVSVRDALNTRFDIYDNGLNNACGTNGSLCPPSTNTRKDLAQKGGSCALVDNTGNSSGWRLPSSPYPGAATTVGPLTDTQAAALSPMGYPHDICHSFSEMGDCTPLVAGEGNRVGDGNWDRYAYFLSHPADYPGLTTKALVDTFMQTTFGTKTPTRYQVYSWEMQTAANRAARLHTGVNVGAYKASSQPVCSPPGIIPDSNTVDRRVLTVAVVNCTAEGVKGKTTDVAVRKWIDIFLTEPSLARTVGTPTENSDVYVEVVGQTQNATDEGAVQLVKKSVPYLIE
jgi:Flp pilus assembly protein TadG